MPDIHPLPFVGRTSLIEQLLSRLRLPDGVRDRPRDFIQPGFYGLGGIGKSRLLTAFAESTHFLTPYSVLINFDSAGGHVLATPLDLVRFIIDRLEALDYAARPLWQRVRWKQNNPFNACRQILSDTSPGQVIQTISVREGQASHITQQVDVGSMIVSRLREPLCDAFCHLAVQSQTGLLKVKTARHCPLIVILLDTVDMAPRPVREWLPQLSNLFAHHNTVKFHAMVVAAGRQAVTGFLETPIPPLNAAESAVLVRSYVSHRLDEMAPFQRRASVALLNERPLLNEVVSQGEGIPLLLQLLADVAGLDPTGWAHLTSSLPGAHEARLRYVIEHYLERLRTQATDQDDEHLWQSYFLLLYGAIPRQLDGAGLLRSLLLDLPGTAYGGRTNFEALWQSLSREPFVVKTADGALVFHNLVRAGCLDYLRRTDPEQWQRLHERASTWYEAHGDPIATMQHALHADYRGTIQRTKDAISQALAAHEWRRAQDLIETTASVDLTAEDDLWMTLYKADLAWGEGSQALALERLRRLYGDDVPELIHEEVGARLERWLDLDVGLENKAAAHETIELPAGVMPDLSWWAAWCHLPAVQAHALRALGNAALRQDRYAEAEGLLRRALGLYEAVESRLGQAEALLYLGNAALRQDRYAEAEGLLRRALGLYEAVESRLGQAQALLSLGDVALRQDRYAEAEPRLRRALGLYEAVESRLGQAHALLSLGNAALRQDRYAEAEGLLRRALGLYEAVESRLGQAHALLSLGNAALRQDRYAEAEGLLDQALGMYRDIGLPHDTLGWSIIIGGRTLDQHDQHLSQGHPTLARQACALAHRLYQWANEAAFQSYPSDDAGRLRQGLAAFRMRLADTCGDLPHTKV
jgi:tetratricopeptide (TPR) repeat protein